MNMSFLYRLMVAWGTRLRMKLSYRLMEALQRYTLFQNFLPLFRYDLKNNLLYTIRDAEQSIIEHIFYWKSFYPFKSLTVRFLLLKLDILFLLWGFTFFGKTLLFLDELISWILSLFVEVMLLICLLIYFNDTHLPIYDFHWLSISISLDYSGSIMCVLESRDCAETSWCCSQLLWQFDLQIFKFILIKLSYDMLSTVCLKLLVYILSRLRYLNQNLTSQKYINSSAGLRIFIFLTSRYSLAIGNTICHNLCLLLGVLLMALIVLKAC